MAMEKWVPIFEWGLGNEETVQAIGGIVVDIADGLTTRIGSFPANRICHEDGDVQYGNGGNLSNGFSWIMTGERSTITLI